MTNTKGFLPFILFAVCGLLWFGARLLYGGHIEIPAVRTMAVYLLLAPFAEELFFRKVVQGEIGKRLKYVRFGLSSANVIASVIFSLFHLFSWGWPHAALVFIPSLCFGYLFDRTGGITLPILLHAVYNLNIFIM